jgi:ribonuclease D
MYVYRERTCLLQANAGGELYVLDTLALIAATGWEPLTATAPCPALDGLRAAFARNDRRLWVHGGEYDCATLRRDFALELGGVWDTQQAASLLGWEKTGYGALVERICGVALDKAYTQYDWATRPLDPKALDYAIDDVVHLPAVAQHLEEAILAADLVEEHAIASAAVAASGWNGGFDPADWWRMKGVRDVAKERLPVLHALYAWRDGVAKAHNQPPGRILNGEALLSVARSAPTNFQLLKRSGLKSWLLAEHGEELIALIKDALANPPALPPYPNHREVDDAEVRRERRLKDWRMGESTNRGVTLQVVLPAKALEHLKRYGAGDLASVPQLGPKRIDKYGRRLRELCD